MRALKKIMAALALTQFWPGAVRTISSRASRREGRHGADNQPPGCGVGRAAVHPPVAGDTIAVFDTSAGVFKAVLFSTEAPQAVQNFTTLAQQAFTTA